MDLGVNVNAIDEDGKTVLFNIWGPNMYNIIDILLEAGIDTTIKSDYELTAIQTLRAGALEAKKYANYIEHRQREMKYKQQESYNCHNGPNFL